MSVKKLELSALWALGPQHAEIMAMLDVAKSLSHEDCKRLAENYSPYRLNDIAYQYDEDGDGDDFAEWVKSQEAAIEAATRTTVWGRNRQLALLLSWELMDEAMKGKLEDARDAARDAVIGLVTRNLIGSYRYTEEHYKLLTSAWRDTVGIVHHEDNDL